MSTGLARSGTARCSRRQERDAGEGACHGTGTPGTPGTPGTRPPAPRERLGGARRGLALATELGGQTAPAAGAGPEALRFGRLLGNRPEVPPAEPRLLLL